MIGGLKHLLALALASATIAVAADARAQDPDVTATSRVDRPAVWIGDRATFTATIVCRRQTDILTEDVTPDKLKLPGLEVLSTTTARSVQPEGTTRYDIRYVLATYRFDMPVLQIAPLTVRYFVRRPGAVVEGGAPAGTVVVPGAVIAFRSVLPDGQAPPPRDAAAPPPRPLPYSVMRPIGLALVVLALVPIARLGLDFAFKTAPARRPTTRSASSRRQARQEVKATMAALDTETPHTVEERRAVFARLDDVVRRHITEAWDVPIRQVGAAEAEARLAARASQLPTSIAGDVMRACEVALYGPPETVPSAESWRETLRRAEDVIAAG